MISRPGTDPLSVAFLQKSSVLLHSLHQIHTHFGISHQVTSFRVYEYETHTQPLSVTL